MGDHPEEEDKETRNKRWREEIERAQQKPDPAPSQSVIKPPADPGRQRSIREIIDERTFEEDRKPKAD